MHPETKTPPDGAPARTRGTAPSVPARAESAKAQSTKPSNPNAPPSRGRERDGRFVGDRYRLVERLGLGGSAEVWRAVVVDRPEDGTDGVGESGSAGGPETAVAVKVLHPYLVPDGTSKVRLIAEARAVRQLRHPGIVQLRDVVLNDAEVALVFDYVAGGSLADEIRSTGRIGAHRAADVAAQLADALAYAHERGIVHRDVTPGNVLLDAQRRPRLTDFGIARLIEESAATVTVTGTVLGTLRYMSPEQLAGRPVDGNADVYSLGAVLYEMLAGQPPYDARTPVALVEQQAAPPPALPSDVPPPLAGIAHAALRRVPADRPSAAELRDALRTWLDGGEVGELSPAGSAARTERLPRAAVGAAAGGAAAAAAAPVAAATPSAGGIGGTPAPRGVVPARTAPASPRRRSRGSAAALLLVGALVAGLAISMGLSAANGGHEAVNPATARPAATPTPTATPRATPSATPIPAVVAPAPVRAAPAPKPPHHKKKRKAGDG